ncbi:uncharacterized protein [Prorops nasuta]|uniref:uncharacterized protein n=1 Tax=Prorops nasuta TaxID=863751 RepID=UPI0034CDFB95
MIIWFDFDSFFVGRYKNKPWIPTKNSRICSKHFVRGKKCNDPRKDSYNPTIFPWTRISSTTAAPAERSERREARKSEELRIVSDSVVSDFIETVNLPLVNKCEIAVHTDPSEEVTIANGVDRSNTLYCWQDSSRNEASTQTYIFVKKPTNKDKKIMFPKLYKSKSIATNVNIKDGFQWSASIKDNSSMKQLGGVTISFFTILLNILKVHFEGPSKFYRTLCPADRLLLFLMKMKLGLTFTALGCIFKVSTVTASSIFYSILHVVFEETKTWIFWPSKEAVKLITPASFANYPNCRAIIDCTELQCETPPTIEQRALMYSTYKSGFTVKYLIAITPSGYISFISKGYGGRATDGFIANDSGFIKLLEPGDEVMADKGFPQIRSELLKKECTIIMPPFAFDPQFTREEVLEGYSIASVRIHVERAIQRIKIFRVLDRVNIEMLPYIDTIMHVACVLANNKEPLIKPTL